MASRAIGRSSEIVLSNVLDLQLGIPGYFSCALSDKSGNAPATGSTKKMWGPVYLVWNYRYDGSGGYDANKIWQEVSQATDVDGHVPASLTYLFSTTRGSAQYFYIGKTVNTLAQRYPGGPTSGGMAQVFGNYTAHDYMDVTLYQTSNPSLVEGWCYALAEARAKAVVNIMDPT